MNKITKCILITFVFICVVTVEYIFAGDLDITFGTGGIVTTSIARLDLINSVTLQSDNKIVVTGSSAAIGEKLITARYNSDGTLDMMFSSSGIAKLLIGSKTVGNAVTLQDDSKIVACGFAFESQTNFALARYNTNGSLDTTFNGSGSVTTSIGAGASANSVKIQTDGKIVAGGTAVQGSPQFALARYNANGSLDTSFNSTGTFTTQIGLQASINQIAIQTDGKIVAVGYVFDGATIKFALARYNTNGTLDTGFGTTGIVTTAIGSEAQARSVAIQSDGKIVVAGRTTEANVEKFAVVRYDSSGNLDTTFNTTGIITTAIQHIAQAHAVVIQSDGKIVTGGFSFGDEATQFALARYTTTGVLDTMFGMSGIVVTTIGGNDSDSQINSLVIQPDGKIVAVGFSNTEFALARYNP